MKKTTDKEAETADNIQLTKLLKDQDACIGLHSLTALTLMFSSEWKNSEVYTAIDEVFCDGFELFIGSIFKQNAAQSKRSLLNKIQREVSELIVKKISSSRPGTGGRTYGLLLIQKQPI